MAPSDRLDALVRLQKRRLALAIHDASFPADADENVGRGSPYDRGALRFLERMRTLGFNAIQLGPQGQTSRDNRSPYDSTAFSRSWMSIALGPLVERGWLPRETLDSAVEHAQGDTPHANVYDEIRAALETVYRRASSEVASELAEYRSRHRSWLEPDGLYDAIESLQGGRHWRDWPEPLQRCRPMPEHELAVDRWALWQMIAEAQHRALFDACRRIGLALFGDLQVGWAARDVWRARALFLEPWRMGAPPSRTNPEGQAWGYPVLDPDRYDEGGLALLTSRIERMSWAYDAIRIDHPHGLVCPWVYTDDVVAGGRLFGSPERPDLAHHAITRIDQLDLEVVPWADGRERGLDASQMIGTRGYSTPSPSTATRWSARC